MFGRYKGGAVSAPQFSSPGGPHRLDRFVSAGDPRNGARLDLAERLGGRRTCCGSRTSATTSCHDNVGPLPALQAVAQLLGDKDGDRRILYLLSDFRAPQWNDPADLR